MYLKKREVTLALSLKSMFVLQCETKEKRIYVLNTESETNTLATYSHVVTI